MLRQIRPRDGRRGREGGRAHCPPRRGSLRPQILHPPKSRTGGSWANRMTGKAAGALSRSARSGPGIRGTEVLLQEVARLFLSCPGGASDRVLVPPLFHLLVLLACPSGPADSREVCPEWVAEALSGGKGAGPKGAQRSTPAYRMASRPVNCRFVGQEKPRACLAWAAPAPVPEGSCGQDAFRSLGRRKTKPLGASEATARLGKTASSESTAAWGAAEPPGWGRGIRAP